MPGPLVASMVEGPPGPGRSRPGPLGPAAAAADPGVLTMTGSVISEHVVSSLIVENGQKMFSFHVEYFAMR